MRVMVNQKSIPSGNLHTGNSLDMQSSVHPSTYALRKLPDSVLLLGKSFQTKLTKLNDDLVDLNEKLTGRPRYRRPNEALDELLSIEKRLLETPLTVQDDQEFARRIDLILGLPPKSQPPSNEWEIEAKRVFHESESIYPPSRSRKPISDVDTAVKQLKLSVSSSSSVLVPSSASLRCSSHLHISLLPSVLDLSSNPPLPAQTAPQSTPQSTPQPAPQSESAPQPRSVVVVYAGAHFPGTLLREDGQFVEVLFPDGVQARLLKTQLLP